MDAFITAAALRQSLTSENPPLVIDVRKEPTFLAARDAIRGALRRDPAKVDLWKKTLPAAAGVVVYCVHGHEVSQGAAQILGAKYVQGGIEAWREQGGELAPKPAGILIARKKFGEAKDLLDDALTPELVSQSSSGNLLARRAELNARRGQWQEAAADAALAFEHQPYNRARYPVLAALLAKTHDRPAYEKLCKRLLATYSSTTNIFVADQVAKSCLFLPFLDADLPAISHLADITVTLGVGDAGAMPYFQDCKALCEYRQGHYAEAVEWAQKPLKIPGIYVHGHSYAVLAMAYWRLGEKENARAMLAKGDTLEPGIMPASIAEDPGSAWLAWLFARIQLDEATALIQPSSMPENNSNKP